MRLKPGKKGKTLGGAPRAGKWTRDPSDGRTLSRHRGSWILLGVFGVLILAGIGTFGAMAWQRLSGGLVSQYRASVKRPDWVRVDELPPHVVAAFLAVVDTASFQRVPTYGGGTEPMLARDLVSQIHRLDPGVADQAWRSAMVPLAERRLSRRALFEFYLNRISMGRTGDWPVYGVMHGAEEYFGKDPRRLTPAEAATLAGILLPPRLNEPEAHPGAVGPRRNEVLRRMRAAGVLDDAGLRAALAEPLAFQPGVDYAPMTRPADWGTEPEVIRLPPELRPTADTTAAEAGE